MDKTINNRTETSGLPIYLQVLAPEQLDALRNLWQEQTFQPGMIIFNENEQSDEIYFLLSGDVEIIKWDEKYTHQYQLHVLSGEQVFGDVSFLTGAPRSATIKALSEVHVVKLSRKLLRANHPEAKQIEQVLANHIAFVNVTRLQEGNKEQVRGLEKQIEELNARLEFGGFLVMTIAVFSIITLVSRYVSTTETIFNPTSLSFIFIFGSALMIPVVYFTWRYRRPPRDFGLFIGDWKRDLLEVTGILVVLSVLLGIIMMVDARFFNNSLGLNLDLARFSLIGGIIYMVSAFGQELLARGIIQGGMQRLLLDEKGARTIIWSSAIFAVMHVNYGFIVIGVTFFASLLFGYVYWRQKSLLGVSVLHGVIGVIAALVGIIPS